MAQPVKSRPTDTDVLKQRKMTDRFFLEREGLRAQATRQIAGFDYVHGDLHTHSVYSDGTGTIPEIVEVARARKLDFVFVTDHGTIRQKCECRRHKGIWWGQEPGAGPHHVCMLAGKKKITPSGDMAKDAETLRALGNFFFYPHPTGWYPTTWYAEQRVAALRQVGREFAIEVMNGIFRADALRSEWCDSYIELWDQLLGEGYRVLGLGASDAHAAVGVGDMWTGFVDTRAGLRNVIATLKSGEGVFASSGPAINISCGDTPMGAVIQPHGARARVRIRCADSYGLNWVRVVQDGRMQREIRLRGKERMDESVDLALPSGDSYVRVECAANDDKRAYANPIYFRR